MALKIHNGEVPYSLPTILFSQLSTAFSVTHFLPTKDLHDLFTVDIISNSGSGFGDLTSIWLAQYKDVAKNIVIKKTYLDISDSDKIDLMRVSSSFASNFFVSFMEI